MSASRVVAALLVLGGTATVGACGASGGGSASDADSGYDATSVARQIRDAQQAKVPDLKVDRATCPEKVSVKKGTTFECTVAVAGVPAPYTVKIKSVTASKVNFGFAPAKAIVSVAVAEKFLRDEAKAQNLQGVKVACPQAAVVVQDPGTTFPCTLSMGGQSQKVAVAIKDLDGTIGLAN